ncbi:MAG: DUF4369 domain-containing protein [Bacteroides sp.]|nr:DUF4369 domain-containing protein [Bacteroides sp.]
MKKTILLVLAISCSLLTFAQKSYTINGVVEDKALNNTTVYLYEYDDLLSSVDDFLKENMTVIDSTQVKNNKFKFTNKVPKDNPVLCLLYVPAMKYPFQVALEPGTIEVEILKGGDTVPYYSTLKGTSVNNDLDEYLLKTIREITKLSNEMQASSDADKFQEIIEILTKVSTDLRTNTSLLVNKYIDKKPLGEQLLFTFFELLEKEDLDAIKSKLSKETLDKLNEKQTMMGSQLESLPSLF